MKPRTEIFLVAVLGILFCIALQLWAIPTIKAAQTETAYKYRPMIEFNE